jgi:hypothetical protein
MYPTQTTWLAFKNSVANMDPCSSISPSATK